MMKNYKKMAKGFVVMFVMGLLCMTGYFGQYTKVLAWQGSEETKTATLNELKLSINGGQVITLQSYIVDQYNYIRVRDVFRALNFHLENHHITQNLVCIDTSRPYSIYDTQPLPSLTKSSANIKIEPVNIVFNDMYNEVDGFNFEDRYYLKLADLSKMSLEAKAAKTGDSENKHMPTFTVNYNNKTGVVNVFIDDPNLPTNAKATASDADVSIQMASSIAVSEQYIYAGQNILDKIEYFGKGGYSSIRHKEIMRTDLNGKNKETLFDETFKVDSKFLLFDQAITTLQQNKLVSYHLDTMQMIGSDSIGSGATGYDMAGQFGKYKNSIVYVNGSVVYIANPDFSEKKQVFAFNDKKIQPDFTGTYFRISGDYVYYLSDNQLYRAKIDGSSEEQLFKVVMDEDRAYHSGDNFFIANNTLCIFSSQRSEDNLPTYTTTINIFNFQGQQIDTVVYKNPTAISKQMQEIDGELYIKDGYFNKIVGVTKKIPEISNEILHLLSSSRPDMTIKNNTLYLCEYDHPTDRNVMFIDLNTFKFNIVGNDYFYTIPYKYGMAARYNIPVKSSEPDKESEFKIFDDKIKQIIASIIKPGMSDLEKERAIHDYLIDNVSYDFTLQQTSTTDAILYGKATCNGYSGAFHVLLDMAGVKNYNIGGLAGGFTKGPHAWNIVYIDGQYKHVDVTFDDGVGSLKYFNISDDEIKKDHEWAKDAYPKCY